VFEEIAFSAKVAQCLKIGYNKIDSKDHALFKIKDKIILIHKFIDPKGNQISNDINLLIINSNVFTAKVAQCLNSSTFVGSIVITMVFNSDFNPFMATASNISSDIFLLTNLKETMRKMLIRGYLCTNNIVHLMIYQTKKAQTHFLFI
jgi:hypothetical protein